MQTSWTPVESDRQLAKVVAELQALPEDAAELAVDTETTGLDPTEAGARLLLVQVGTRRGDVYVIDARQCDVSALKPVLEDGRVCVIQNAVFDYKWLKWCAGIEMPRMYCTMLAELLLTAGAYQWEGRRHGGASLGALAQKYAGAVLDKKLQTSFIGQGDRPFTEEQLQYAAADVPHLFTIMDGQMRELKRGALMEVAAIEFNCIPAVGDMELNGMRLDVPTYAGVIERARVLREEVVAELVAFFRCAGFGLDLFGDLGFNLDAPKQLLTVFASLGVALENTKDETLAECDHPFARLIERYREQNKRVTVYGEKVLAKVNPTDGRIHANFRQLGSDAGRFSCDDPNLQNMPATPEFRSCFIAEEGNLLVIGDYSQMEPRILAELSGDEGLIEVFRSGRDLYSETAARMYGVPIEEAGKGSQLRQDAKIITLALAYGQGALSLSRNLRCSMEEAKGKMDRYFETYPAVAAWLKDQAANVLGRGETRTMAGRRRIMPSPGVKPAYQSEGWDDWRMKVSAMGRKAKNTPIQGSNADMTKIALALVRGYLRDADLRPGLLSTVHDEIILEVPEAHGEEAREYLVGGMLLAGQRYLKRVPVKVDAGVSKCWEK